MHQDLSNTTAFFFHIHKIYEREKEKEENSIKKREMHFFERVQLNACVLLLIFSWMHLSPTTIICVMYVSTMPFAMSGWERIASYFQHIFRVLFKIFSVTFRLFSCSKVTQVTATDTYTKPKNIHLDSASPEVQVFYLCKIFVDVQPVTDRKLILLQGRYSVKKNYSQEKRI